MPATNKPATNGNATFRGAVITHYGEGWSELPPKIQFLAYGDEICRTTLREHKQAFAYANKAMRLTGWKKIFPGDHIEQMRGTFAENEKYCSKEGSYHKYGTPPMANGLQRTMELVKRKCDDIAEGETVMDIAEDPELFQTVSRCTPFLKEYVQHVRGKKIKHDHNPPEVFYLYGKAGSGKTRYVREKETNIYDVPDGHEKWRDGYAGESAVLFDNMEATKIHDRSSFLKQLDRYPIQVPVKGGMVWWKPKRIYVTALVSPEIFALAFQKPQEFLRRVTKTIELKADD